MIISHSKKFCYWKIARTGSNTAELCIRMSGVLDLEQDLVTSCHFFPASHNVQEQENMSGHTTPDEAISLGYITQAQYDEYDHYTIVREPLERWVSAYAYHCRMNLKEKITPLEYFGLVRGKGYARYALARTCRHIKADDLVTRRQSDYLAMGRVQTFPFSDYEASIKKIVSKIGGRLEDVPKIEHKTRRLWKRHAMYAVEANPLGEQLREYYRDDFKLKF